MINVTLYTRKDCHLCEQIKTDLEALQEDIPHRLVEVDIDGDPSLQSAFGEFIPVVEIGPYRLKAPITRQELHMTLGAATDRRTQLVDIHGDAYHALVQRSQTVSKADRFSFWLSKHYLAVVSFVLFLYVGLPFLAPTLMEAGLPGPARALYIMYSPLCHQFGFRSFFLFGEQPYYPLKEAGLSGVLDFESATGITGLANPNGLARLQARAYIGNPVQGYKVALCERDVAIYASMLFFAIFFALSKRRLKPLHWMFWLLLGLGPIGLDGFSQLFSQFQWAWLVQYLPYRESTPFLRTMTGAFFGFFTAWYGIPYLEETMRESRQLFIKKFAVSEAAK